jgi:hypothetical protein
MLFVVLALAATTALAQSEAQKTFDKLKSLTGTWQGKDAQGKTVQVSYRMTAGGSALMSEIEVENMITMFHFDGDRLLMTHYCGAGNQPRMKGSSSADGKTITFEFVDATNLPTPQTGHMHRVVFNLIDANHHTEAWTFLDNGKEVKELFELQRKS